MSWSPTTALHAAFGRMRQRKIALSLAIVGALAAPYAFGTYKEPRVYLVSVPLTAHEKEQRANYLDTGDCKSFDDDPYVELLCDLYGENFKLRRKAELERGTRPEWRDDLPKYWMMYVGTAAATFISLFGLAYLIPMWIRGLAFLVRRYWKWLNA